jgi:uncharacterized membrane protein YgdD (TMEM256/DUF423 family)
VTFWLKLAALAMLLGVVLGVFGAHALKARLTPDHLEAYRTGVLYQFIHGLGLFVVAFTLNAAPQSRAAHFAGVAFTAGILLFSGSLYLLSLTGIRTFGAITPIGGLCFIAGWAALVAGRI